MHASTLHVTDDDPLPLANMQTLITTPRTIILTMLQMSSYSTPFHALLCVDISSFPPHKSLIELSTI